MIRAATQDDLPCLARIVAQTISAMNAQGICQLDSHYPSTADLEADILQRSLYVITYGDAPRGLVALNDHQEPEYASLLWSHSGPSLVVHRLAIAPSCQGKGLAGKLMDFTESYARSKGYASIRLDAFSENPAACRLYQRRGYRHVGDVRFRMGLFHCYEKVL
jgi:ribosomal protein S18 acetylase RimI-like enzyme